MKQGPATCGSTSTVLVAITLPRTISRNVTRCGATTTRRGGSSAAGWAALGGGLAGMILGGLLPVPLLGSLVGMLVGSYLCAYAVEKRRLRQSAPAARIARGAVWARLAVLFLKTAAALGMSILLWYAVLT